MYKGGMDMFKLGDVVKMKEQYLFLHSLVLEEDASDLRVAIASEERANGTYISKVVEGETMLSSPEGLLIVTEQVFELAD